MKKSIFFVFVVLFSIHLQAVPDWKPVFDDKPLRQEEVAAIKAALPSKAIVEPNASRRILIFSATQVARHRSIAHGKVALKEMGLVTGAYTTVVSDDPANFESEVLKTFDTVVMLNPTWDFFMPNKEQSKQFSSSQLSALKSRHLRLVDNLVNFVKQGGGLVGIHAASDSCYSHSGYGEMIGGYFNGHPWRARNNVTIVIEDPAHAVMQPVFEGMKDFSLVEEIYQYKNNSFSRDRSRVLLHLDTARSDQVEGLKREDGDYPVAWVQAVGQGRVFYTNIGHNPSMFSNPLILKHYLAGIQFATGDLVGDTTPSGPLKTVESASPSPLHTLTWVGGAGNRLLDEANWNPSKSWNGGTVLRFDGEQQGDLDLRYRGGQQSRVLYEFTADQKEDVSIQLSGDQQSRAFAIGFNDGDMAISITANSGKVSFNGQDTTRRMVALFGSGQATKKNLYIQNEGRLEFGEYVLLRRGAEDGDHTLIFRGTGETIIRGIVGSMGFGGGLLVDHGHTLTLAGTYGEGAKQSLFINGGCIEFVSAAALAGDQESWAPIRVGNNVEGHGMLRYIGSEDVHIRRRIQIGNGVSGANQMASAIIDNGSGSGSGKLIFTNAKFNEPQLRAMAPRALTLAGDNSTGNEIIGEISDNNTSIGGIVNLIKTGTGEWILSGENSYTGSTQIEQGTLAILSAKSIDRSSAVIVNAEASLDVSQLAGGISIGDDQTLGGGGTIRGDLTLTDSANYVFVSNGTLTVTGDVTLHEGFTANRLVDVNGAAIDWHAVDDGTYTLIESDMRGGAKLQLRVHSGNAFIL